MTTPFKKYFKRHSKHLGYIARSLLAPNIFVEVRALSEAIAEDEVGWDHAEQNFEKIHKGPYCKRTLQMCQDIEYPVR